MDSATKPLTPLVLLVDDQEWTSRSVESVLKPRGHVVLKAYTAQQALDLVSKVSPDAILVDVDLPDRDGIDLIRALRAAPTVHPTTPILSLCDDSLGRVERLEALSAGAWDVLTHPLDPSELILRLDTFVRAKQDADRVRDHGLTDPETGFYNVRGILQRAKEISADAHRFDRPVTCVAFGAQRVGERQDQPEGAREALGRPIADALRAVTRICDTVGMLGPGEFVVVAPGTDQKGAVRLADRVLEALEAAADRTGYGVDATTLGSIRAGVSEARRDESMPEDLLLRATMALREAQNDQGSFRVRAYES